MPALHVGENAQACRRPEHQPGEQRRRRGFGVATESRPDAVTLHRNRRRKTVQKFHVGAHMPAETTDVFRRPGVYLIEFGKHHVAQKVSCFVVFEICLVHHEFKPAPGGVSVYFRLGRVQQRADVPSAHSLHARRARRAAATQNMHEYAFRLVGHMVCQGDYVAAVKLLKRPVTQNSGGGFFRQFVCPGERRRIHLETEKRHAVTCRQFFDEQTVGFALRPYAVLHVNHHKFYIKFFAGARQLVQQHDGIHAAADGGRHPFAFKKIRKHKYSLTQTAASFQHKTKNTAKPCL